MPSHAAGNDHPAARGVQLEQLATVFDRLRNPRNWKGPIASEIAAADRQVVEEAILWFTATAPVFDPVPGRPDRLMVAAAGYEEGPWGVTLPTGAPGVPSNQQVG